MPYALTTSVARARHDRLLGGVCSGAARAWRLDPTVVRFAAMLLALAGGVGIVLYLLGWAFLPEAVDDEAMPQAPTNPRDDLAAASIAVGLVLVLRSMGVWFADEIALAGGIVVLGAGFAWGRVFPRSRPETGGGALRIAIGVVLALLGLAVFGAQVGDVRSLTWGALGGIAIAAGIGLVAGPYVAGLARDLTAERRARLRSEERAEIAAHLHDSVLQTLSLIQTRSGDSREVSALARRQERELRAWLYGTAAPVDSTLAGALRRDLARLEDDHQVRVETVVVGDSPLTESAQAVLAAAREAVTNAAVHAGVERIDVYLEASPDRIVAYVRDRGRGFDPAGVAPDRRGISESIVARMQRAGGTAAVRSEPGAGTEVTLEIANTAP